MRARLVLPLLALTLAGCSSSAPAAEEPSVAASSETSAASPSNTADPCGPDSTLTDEEILAACPDGAEEQGNVDAEGSVTTEDGSFVLYPDGLRAEIVSVTTQAPTMSNAEAGDDTEVRVTVRLSNTGTTTVPLFPDGTIDYVDTLLYGANRYEANAFFSEEGGAEDAPQQLVPGTDVDIVSTYTMPSAELGTLAFTVSPNAQVYTTYTFTDVNTLLAR